MKEVTLKFFRNRFWCVAEVWKGDTKIAEINKFYEVNRDWILIYDTVGGQGTGYIKGELLQKIYIGDCEFKKIDINEYDNIQYDGNEKETHNNY